MRMRFEWNQKNSNQPEKEKKLWDDWNASNLFNWKIFSHNRLFSGGIFPFGREFVPFDEQFYSKHISGFAEHKNQCNGH